MEQGNKLTRKLSPANLFSFLLLPFNYFLYLIELVQRFKWSKIIDINIYYLVTNLAENRVVELEETQLISVVFRC